MMVKNKVAHTHIILLLLGALLFFWSVSYIPNCVISNPLFSIWLIRIAGILLLTGIFYIMNCLRTQISMLRDEKTALIKRYERLELTIDTGEIGFWDWDLVTDEVYFSPNYFIMLGYQPDELPMKLSTWLMLLHPEDKERVVPKIQKYVEQATPYAVEFRMQCKDKSWKWISGRGKYYNIGDADRPQRAFGVHVDINERKLAEQKNRNLATVIEQAIEGIAVADLDGYLQYANPVWVKMHGYDSADALKNKHIKIFHTEEQFRNEVLVFNEKVKHTGMHKGEVGHLRKDGTTFPTVMTTALLKDENGKPYGIAGFAQDITEQIQNKLKKKQTDKALALALKKAEHANKAKSEFLANMSHELRTPMNGILGMNSLLLKTKLNEEQREYGDIIHKSGMHLLKMINDILNYSQIDTGKMVLRIAKFNLIKMVTDTIDLMTLQAQEKKLSIQCHISSKTPSLLIGDEKVLQKILVHLIDNAIKYTFQGEISINVGLAAEDASYADIQFTIKDTGIGIPDDKQETIFSAFYQIDSSSTKQYGGTGLGLALAKQLVTLMEGNIFVESTPDIGSTFWFSVRLKKCWD